MATTSGHPNRSRRGFGRCEIRAPPSSMPLSVRFGTDSAMTPKRCRWELATRSRRRAPPTIIFWASLINLKFAAAFILSIETLDCRIPFRNIAHRNEPKAARLAGFAISDQFDFRNSAERLKEFPQCAFCHVKGKISDVKLHDDK